MTQYVNKYLSLGHQLNTLHFSDNSPGPERVGLPGDMGAAHNQFQEEEKDSEEGKCGCEWGSDGRGG